MVRSPTKDVLITKIPTNLTIQLEDDYGNIVTELYVTDIMRVYAYLSRVDTGAPITGASVYVVITDPDGTTSQWTLSPSGDRGAGWYFIRFDVSSLLGRYSHYCEFLGDATFEGCEEKATATSSDNPLLLLPLIGAAIWLALK